MHAISHLILCRLDPTNFRPTQTYITTRNVRYRVATPPGWECEFTILWDKTLVSRNQMESVLNDAGVLVGLADGRSVGFGRFETMSFEIEEVDAKKATTA